MILSNASPIMIGSLVIILVGLIVIYDVLHLTRNKKTVPKLGYLPKGGFAWSSTIKEEFFRNGPNILTLICMAILPWLLASASNTPFWILAVFDILLMLLILTMLLPKGMRLLKLVFLLTDNVWSGKKLKKLIQIFILIEE